MCSRLFRIVVIFLSTLNLLPLFGQDSTVVIEDDPKTQGISSIYELREPELIFMHDSLFESGTKDSCAFATIKLRLDELNAMNPKNQFQSGFAFWPAHRFYGVWSTTILFPYRDSLYKSEQITELDLSPQISGDFSFPFSGVVTSKYGYRDSAFHPGIDIDLNRGDSVHKAFGGMVRFAARGGGYGNVVTVRHYNRLETVYAHLWKIKVKLSDIVTSGQLLGLGGSTGHSTGTHLHFEMRYRDVAIAPYYIINWDTRKLNANKIELIRTCYGYTVHPVGLFTHWVKKGDNVSKVSQRYAISIKQLKAWNGWEGYVRLTPGMLLRIAPPEEQNCTF
jgi:Peptidase family M23/LysM domain